MKEAASCHASHLKSLHRKKKWPLMTHFLDHVVCITFRKHSVTPPGLLQLLLSEERADVHGVAELHVGQFAGHGDGCVPAIRRMEGCFKRFICNIQTAEYRKSFTDLWYEEAASVQATVSFLRPQSHCRATCEKHWELDSLVQKGFCMQTNMSRLMVLVWGTAAVRGLIVCRALEFGGLPLKCYHFIRVNYSWQLHTVTAGFINSWFTAWS